MTKVLPTVPRLTTLFGMAAAALVLLGCSSTDFTGDKIDYKSQATKTPVLDVPPDLSQLQRDGRFQPQVSGSVSASSFGASAAATATTVSSTANVAPASNNAARVMREGNQRWLAVSLPAEQLWPQLRSFWQERGFVLVIDSPETGVMETDWVENRAKIPQDVIRRTIGKVFDSFYDSGERDRYRMRVERSGSGSEVFISHRGLVEVYVTDEKERTTWTNRPNDPQLEAEMLSRLMVKLGTKEETARATVAAPTPVAATPRARAIGGATATSLQLDEGFDRAWRRVGLALDRSGFTVEDRDRAGGLYFVRYVDPKKSATSDAGFFAKLLDFGKSDTGAPPVRYRISLKSDSPLSTTVSVLNAQGAPEASAVGQRITVLLVDELK